MCIKLLGPKTEVKYDMESPLESQLDKCDQIVVDYEPEDPCIDKFLNEVERLCKNGITAHLNIKFNHNNFLLGAKAGKRVSKLAEDLQLNEVIKFMVTNYAESDKKLQEMANYCMDGTCREQQKA